MYQHAATLAMLARDAIDISLTCSVTSTRGHRAEGPSLTRPGSRTRRGLQALSTNCCQVETSWTSWWMAYTVRVPVAGRRMGLLLTQDFSTLSFRIHLANLDSAIKLEVRAAAHVRE